MTKTAGRIHFVVVVVADDVLFDRKRWEKKSHLFLGNFVDHRVCSCVYFFGLTSHACFMLCMGLHRVALVHFDSFSLSVCLSECIMFLYLFEFFFFSTFLSLLLWCTNARARDLFVLHKRSHTRQHTTFCSVAAASSVHFFCNLHLFQCTI